MKEQIEGYGLSNNPNPNPEYSFIYYIFWLLLKKVRKEQVVVDSGAQNQKLLPTKNVIKY